MRSAEMELLPPGDGLASTTSIRMVGSAHTLGSGPFVQSGALGSFNEEQGDAQKATEPTGTLPGTPEGAGATTTNTTTTLGVALQAEQEDLAVVGAPVPRLQETTSTSVYVEDLCGSPPDFDELDFDPTAEQFLNFTTAAFPLDFARGAASGPPTPGSRKLLVRVNSIVKDGGLLRTKSSIDNFYTQLRHAPGASAAATSFVLDPAGRSNDSASSGGGGGESTSSKHSSTAPASLCLSPAALKKCVSWDPVVNKRARLRRLMEIGAAEEEEDYLAEGGGDDEDDDDATTSSDGDGDGEGAATASSSDDASPGAPGEDDTPTCTLVDGGAAAAPRAAEAASISRVMSLGSYISAGGGDGGGGGGVPASSFDSFDTAAATVAGGPAAGTGEQSESSSVSSRDTLRSAATSVGDSERGVAALARAAGNAARHLRHMNTDEGGGRPAARSRRATQSVAQRYQRYCYCKGTKDDTDYDNSHLDSLWTLLEYGVVEGRRKFPEVYSKLNAAWAHGDERASEVFRRSSHLHRRETLFGEQLRISSSEGLWRLNTAFCWPRCRELKPYQFDPTFVRQLQAAEYGCLKYCVRPLEAITKACPLATYPVVHSPPITFDLSRLIFHGAAAAGPTEGADDCCSSSDSSSGEAPSLAAREARAQGASAPMSVVFFLLALCRIIISDARIDFSCLDAFTAAAAGGGESAGGKGERRKQRTVELLPGDQTNSLFLFTPVYPLNCAFPLPKPLSQVEDAVRISVIPNDDDNSSLAATQPFSSFYHGGHLDSSDEDGESTAEDHDDDEDGDEFAAYDGPESERGGHVLKSKWQDRGDSAAASPRTPSTAAASPGGPPRSGPGWRLMRSWRGPGPENVDRARILRQDWLERERVEAPVSLSELEGLYEPSRFLGLPCFPKRRRDDATRHLHQGFGLPVDSWGRVLEVVETLVRNNPSCVVLRLTYLRLRHELIQFAKRRHQRWKAQVRKARAAGVVTTTPGASASSIACGLPVCRSRPTWKGDAL